MKIPHEYNKNTNMVAKNKDVAPTPGLKRVKTEGRIGSTAPESWVKGGLSVNNNSKQQSHEGGLGQAAAKHMSPSHKGGVWHPRVAKARARAETPRHSMGIKPINHATGTLKRVKPN